MRFRTSPFCHCEAPAGAAAIPKVARSRATRQSHEIASPEARNDEKNRARNDNRLGEVLTLFTFLGARQRAAEPLKRPLNPHDCWFSQRKRVWRRRETA